jgi:hypothetical protein
MSMGVNKLTITAMEAAAKAVMPEGLFVHVNEVVGDVEDPRAGYVHLIVTTQVYAQSYIEPDMLIQANRPSDVFANHVETNVLELREQLMKIVEAIDAR